MKGQDHNYIKFHAKKKKYSKNSYRNQSKNLLFRRFSKAEKQTVVHKTF